MQPPNLNSRVFSLLILIAGCYGLVACGDGDVTIVASSSTQNGSAATPPPSSGSGSQSGASSGSSGVTVIATSTKALEISARGSDESSIDSSTTLPSSDCSELITTAPRGLACLHCTQPEAEEQSHLMIDILERSCLKNIALNYLVDGTFGNDLAPIYDHLDRLTRTGHRVFLELYLLNGPRQRRGGTKSVPAPEEFRRRIMSDAELRASYSRRVERLLPLLSYANKKRVVIYLVPMLEDNLTDEAFAELYQLTIDALPAELPVAVGRNSCSSCYPGNESGTPDGVFRESHKLIPSSGLSGGIVTNDGREFESEEQLATLRDWAAAHDNIFILWDAERQGLRLGEKGNLIRVPVAKRLYARPSKDDQRELARLLRRQ
jgi:hypothetical protein